LVALAGSTVKGFRGGIGDTAEREADPC